MIIASLAFVFTNAITAVAQDEHGGQKQPAPATKQTERRPSGPTDMSKMARARDELQHIPARAIDGIGDTISVSISGNSVPRYAVVQLSITHSDAEFSNAWEGPVITVTFTSPANKTYRVGGFYHSRNLWKARFAPPETGTWHWSLEWRDERGTQTENGAFDCVASLEKGFVRRHPTNPFRLVFEEGSLYPAIGIGDCILATDHSGSPIDNWGFDGGFRPPGTEPGSSTDIDTYMSAYGNAGFNLFRWSVDNCAFKLWQRIDPSGNVYLEPEGQFGDTLVANLRQHGFRIYMAIFGFNPAFPTDTSDPAKMNAVKRYAKYVVDRYGAYVDFWELMNEFPNPPASINHQWYEIVADYIRSIDPYQHMISTSWERPDLAAIEINSPHWYQDESEFDSDRETDSRFQHWKASGKPVIVGEQGNYERNWDERSALRMRLRSWTAFFVEGTLIFWNVSGFKDNRARPASIYLGPEARGYIRGLQNITAGAEANVERLALTPSSSSIRSYGLRSARMILGYFHHFTSHQEAVSSTLALDLPAAGTVVWIDPATGDTLQMLSVGGGRQTLRMPPFAVDLALRIQWASK